MNDASPASTTNTTSVKPRVQAGRNAHGHAKRKQWTVEFRAWHQMRDRCYNPNANGYENYGGRGITVCDRWNESFSNFLADMGLKPVTAHSLDRKNNDGNYEPSNCRWATKLEQDNNRRTNIFLEFNGENLTISQWAIKLNILPVTLNGRLREGWPVCKALATAVKKNPGVCFNGETKTIKEWAASSGISRACLSQRLKAGWKMQDAISLPPDSSRRLIPRRVRHPSSTSPPGVSF